MGTAYRASSPVMVVCGQIERDFIGVNRGMLHEVNDQIDAIKPITKFARRALDPTEIPAMVHEAAHHLKNGRPRPVEIEVPPETLAEVADIDLIEPEAAKQPTASAEGAEATRSRGGCGSGMTCGPRSTCWPPGLRSMPSASAPSACRWAA